MTDNNQSWPKCNFCENQYDPYDKHTCPGNEIPARFKRPKPRVELSAADIKKAVDGVSTISYGEPGWATADLHKHLWSGEGADAYCIGCLMPFLSSADGMTRQQIGEALDADRALSSQVGGDHYRKMKIQPVEYIIANGIGFLPGNIIKYASRYPDKGGAEDIRKIIHYCKLILEFEYGEKS